MKHTIMTLLILIGGYAISWITTCGLIKLVTLCFGLAFSWSIATGIWIIMCMIWPLFKSNK